MIPPVVVAVIGFRIGAAGCERLLLWLGKQPAQAHFIGTFIGGVITGLLCAVAAFWLLKGWIEKLDRLEDSLDKLRDAQTDGE